VVIIKIAALSKYPSQMTNLLVVENQFRNTVVKRRER